MNNVRKPLTGLLALGVALAMPLAFAQEPENVHQQPWPENQPDTEANQAQVTWSTLDADDDGNLSREEAAALPELAAIFDQVDADGDGILTPQEYQQYAASQGAGSPPPQDDGF